MSSFLKENKNFSRNYLSQLSLQSQWQEPTSHTSHDHMDFIVLWDYSLTSLGMFGLSNSSDKNPEIGFQLLILA